MHRNEKKTTTMKNVMNFQVTAKYREIYLIHMYICTMQMNCINLHKICTPRKKTTGIMTSNI